MEQQNGTTSENYNTTTDDDLSAPESTPREVGFCQSVDERNLVVLTFDWEIDSPNVMDHNAPEYSRGRASKKRTRFIGSESFEFQLLDGKLCEWRMVIDPNYMEEGKRYISLMAYMTKLDWTLEHLDVNYELQLLSASGRIITRKVSPLRRFTIKDNCHGWLKFLPFGYLESNPPHKMDFRAIVNVHLELSGEIETVENQGPVLQNMKHSQAESAIVGSQEDALDLIDRKAVCPAKETMDETDSKTGSLAENDEKRVEYDYETMSHTDDTIDNKVDSETFNPAEKDVASEVITPEEDTVADYQQVDSEAVSPVEDAVDSQVASLAAVSPSKDTLDDLVDFTTVIPAEDEGGKVGSEVLSLTEISVENQVDYGTISPAEDAVDVRDSTTLSPAENEGGKVGSEVLDLAEISLEDHVDSGTISPAEDALDDLVDSTTVSPAEDAMSDAENTIDDPIDSETISPAEDAEDEVVDFTTASHTEEDMSPTEISVNAQISSGTISPAVDEVGPTEEEMRHMDDTVNDQFDSGTTSPAEDAVDEQIDHEVIAQGIREIVADLWKTKADSNTEIICASTAFQVHSSVLKARSPVFRAHFDTLGETATFDASDALQVGSSSFLQYYQNKIADEALDAERSEQESLNGLLEYCYTGTTGLFSDFDKTSDLLLLSKTLEVHSLTKRCMQELMKMTLYKNIRKTYLLLHYVQTTAGNALYTKKDFIRDLMHLKESNPDMLPDLNEHANGYSIFFYQ